MARCEGVIGIEHLPDDFLEDVNHNLNVRTQPPSAGPVATIANEEDSGCLQDVTLAAMAQTLRLHKGNVSTTAKALGVSRNTIYRKKSMLPPDVWG
jgi:transcriptional regulator of acetoin/glycerol metabolism